MDVWKKQNFLKLGMKKNNPAEGKSAREVVGAITSLLILTSKQRTDVKQRGDERRLGHIGKAGFPPGTT